jgi:hypothetical protein
MTGGMDTAAPNTHRAFIGGLPEHGIWTAVGLGRGQFFAILGVSLAVFALLGGPVWTHVRDAHLLRIAVSYAVIPPLAFAALRRNGRRGLVAVATASAVLAFVKLVVTASLFVVLALARG